MNSPVPNLLTELSGVSASDIPEEFRVLHESGGARIEQIVSHGHASPQDFWYDQDEDEWVLLMRGEAVLQYEDGRLVELNAGSYQLIPKHVKHRVESVSEDAVWLAVHLIQQSVE